MNLDDLLKSIREEGDSKGGKIDSGKFLQSKTFQNPLKGQRFQAPGVPSRPVVIKIDPKKIIPKDTNVIGKELGEKIDELVQVIREDNKLEEKSQKEDKKQLEAKKRKDREDRIETKKETKIFLFELNKETGKIGGFFDGLKKFLKTTLLSGLINGLYNFFTDPKNKGKIAGIQEFFRNYWPAVLGAVAYFFTPFGTLVNFVVGTVGKFLLKLGLLVAKNPILAAALGVGVATKMLVDRSKAAAEQILEREEKKKGKPLTTEEKVDKLSERMNILEMLTRLILPSLNKPVEGRSGGGLSMGTDIVPAMLTPGEFVMSRGAVNMFGANTMMAMNKMGGGTNRPKYGKVMGLGGGGIVGRFTNALGISNQEYEAFRKSIAFIESNGQPNNGYGAIGGSNNHYDGKYQLGELGKMDAARILGEPYPGHGKPKSAARSAYRADPAMQDRFFTALALANHGYLSSKSEMYRNLPSNKKLALLGYAHNQGWDPARTYLETGFDDEDGFGTKGSKYVIAIQKALKDLKPVSAAKTTPASSGITNYERTQLTPKQKKQQQINNHLDSIRRKLSDPFDTFIRTPFRRVFPGTPNVPTETRNFVLPPVSSPQQNQSSSQTNDVPTFSVVSGNKMRDLISKDLGIGDLAGVS